MRETPIWDQMVSKHGDPFKKVDKPDNEAVQSAKTQRKQPVRKPRRKR